MKVVILAGGYGTRISEETHLKPKPMVEIGGRPILWHIMKLYAAAGHTEFIICCGYKGYLIKEYFANYFLHHGDVTFDLAKGSMEVHQSSAEAWKVTLVDTGEKTMTGGRLRRVRQHLDRNTFCFTYGDGVSNVDIQSLIAFHKKHGRKATLTAVQPPGRFGAIDLSHDAVTHFHEKPQGEGSWVNGGFFVLEPSVIDAVAGDEITFEREPLESLAAANQLQAFRHEGFWQPMDTLRDKQLLEDLWGARRGSLENMVNAGFWKQRRVLITGHTGFKGSWLALCLSELDAVVTGYSLEPPTNPNLFSLSRVSEGCRDLRGDIGDAKRLAEILAENRPEIVFHLAAQPLVRESYRNPRETWRVNVMGTLEMLEACRASDSVKTVVVITTDKVYENPERGIPFHENDPVGGYDPYSSSKAACEILCTSWRRSFLASDSTRRFGLATARAGNVIGGGDFAVDRLIPDLVRSRISGQPARLRYPTAVRPWQHVLEPLLGYLLIAERLHGDPEKFSLPFNFGPLEADWRSVGEVAETVCQSLHAKWEHEKAPQPHESNLLRLDSARAHTQLDWHPRLRLADALRMTCDWYKGWQNKDDMRSLTLAQIRAYQTLPSIAETN